MIGKLIYKILKYIRSSKIITFVIWRIKIEKYIPDTFWDLTTLVLKKELNQNKEKNKYLDMGCGQFAILGQYFKKINSYSDVTSIDVYKEFIENSIKNSIQNKNDINILQSNLFSNINEKFDLISFNPPYVPASTKNEKLEFPNIRYSDLEGIQTAKDFLSEAKKFLTPDGIILLGMNTFYVPQNVCVKLIKDNGYKLEKITKMKFNTSIVLKLKVI